MRKFLSIIAFLIVASPLYAGQGRETETLNQGIRYFSAGDYEKSVKAFEHTVGVNSQSAEAYTWLGKSYLKLGDNEVLTDIEMLGKAAQAFNNALRVKPDSAEAHFYLGITDLALHNKDEAMKEYEILRELDKEMANSLLKRIHDYAPPRKYESAGAKAGPVMKVKIIGNQVLVPVTLGNGDKTIQVILLLDTGASVSTIMPEVASQLDMDVTRTVPVIGQVVGGGLLEGRRARLDYMTVGPITKKAIHVDIIEHRGPAVRFDGLLGMNFLRSLRYHIDFENQAINWGP